MNGVSGVVPNPSSGAPFAYVLDLTSLAPTDSFEATIFRSGVNWVFLSEVTFEATVFAVPVPAGFPVSRVHWSVLACCAAAVRPSEGVS